MQKKLGYKSRPKMALNHLDKPRWLVANPQLPVCLLIWN